MSSIAEEIEVQRGLREAARNQPSPGPPDFEDDPNYGIRVHAHQNPNRTLVRLVSSRLVSLLSARK
jgi:hypothetical protein